MYVLQIEHPVPSFEAWKAAFDSDPVGRDQGGVRRHRILRPLDDPNYNIIELDFDDLDVANAFLARLRELWNRVEGIVMTNPQARVVETIAAAGY